MSAGSFGTNYILLCYQCGITVSNINVRSGDAGMNRYKSHMRAKCLATVAKKREMKELKDAINSALGGQKIFPTWKMAILVSNVQ